MVAEVSRRTAAVMFTGFYDEAEWFETIGDEGAAEARALLARLHGEVPPRFRGVIRDRSADEYVVEFPTATEAVLAARELLNHERILRPDIAVAETVGPSLPLRIGIAVGEVALEAEDLFGETVVEAARLRAEADRGEALVTDLVRVLTDAPIDSFELRGSLSLKGLPEDTVAHRIVLGPTDWTLAGVEQRRLAAVASVDIVGSTALLADIGTDGAIELRRVADAIVGRATAGYGGEVLDTAGDGSLLWFPTASGAVEAGRQIHREVEAYARRADAVVGFQVRVGVAAGETGFAVTGSQDQLGFAAVEIEAAAEPGTTLVSDVCHRLGRRHTEVRFESALGTPTDPLWAVFDDAEHHILALPSALQEDDDYPLVGRGQEQSLVDDRWQAARDGRPQLVLLTGEPGIGKTRFVTELARRLHNDGAIVLYGGCDAELNTPYRPFATALRAAAELDDDLQKVLTHQQGRLSALFPSPGGRIDGADGPIEREDFFQAVTDLVARLAVIRPLVFVIDDLHWADGPTVELLRHITAGSESTRVLVVGTYRDREIGRQHPLQDLLADTIDRSNSTRIGLSVLSAENVADLLGSRLGGRLDDRAVDVAARVHRDSNGSPFFVGELLRHITDTGVLAEVEGTWTLTRDLDDLPLSDSVRDVVVHRLNPLGDETVGVLATASVIGMSFDVDLLAQVTDRDFETALELVEVAERANLVREGDRAGRYGFVHALVRSTLLDELSATRRALAHRHIGLALESLPGDWVAELAHHWSLASSRADHDKTVRYVQAAAERDVQSLAWESAILRYRQVLELLAENPDTELRVQAETWLALGGALRAMGDPEYISAMKQAGRFAKRGRLGGLVAKAAIGCTKPGAWFPDSNQTDRTLVELAQDALAQLGPDEPIRVRVLGALATNLTFDPGPDRHRRGVLADEAVALARSLERPELLGPALVASFLAEWEPATFEKRVAIAAEVETLSRRTGDAELEFLGGFFTASCTLESGEVERSVRKLADLDDALAETNNSWFQFLVDRMSIAISIALGEPDRPAAIDALFTKNVDSLADAPGTWAAQHGALAIQSGNFAVIANSLTGAAERSQGQGIWSHALALAHIDGGNIEEATKVIDGINDPPHDFMWLVSMQMLAEAGMRLGRADLCERAFDALSPFRGRLGVIASGTLVWGFVSTSIAQAAIGLDRVGLARELLEESEAAARRIGSPYFTSVAQELLSGL